MFNFSSLVLWHIFIGNVKTYLRVDTDFIEIDFESSFSRDFFSGNNDILRPASVSNKAAFKKAGQIFVTLYISSR